MCLSLAGQVVALEGGRAEVRLPGRRLWANALALPGLRLGDHVLIHGGLVLSTITGEEAQEIQSIREVDAAVARALVQRGEE